MAGTLPNRIVKPDLGVIGPVCYCLYYWAFAAKELIPFRKPVYPIPTETDELAVAPPKR